MFGFKMYTTFTDENKFNECRCHLVFQDTSVSRSPLPSLATRTQILHKIPQKYQTQSDDRPFPAVFSNFQPWATLSAVNKRVIF